MNKLLREPIAAPSSVDPALAPLDALLEKALAREPEARFQTADEFARAIEEVAPAIGGLASLRGVARIVKHHAAAKLKREKKLVDDALRALRPEVEHTPEAEDELSAPSNTDISVVSGSLSASKESGVFAQHTQPGNSWTVRPRADATGSLSAVDPAQVLGAPSSRGHVVAGGSAWLARIGVTRPRQLGIAALCAAVAAGGSYLAFAKSQPAQQERAPATAKAGQGWVDGPVSAATAPVATTPITTTANASLAKPSKLAVSVSIPVSNPVPEPIVETSRQLGEDPAQEPAARKASRMRVERTGRTNPRAARKPRRDASPGVDDVMPNPYHTR